MRKNTIANALAPYWKEHLDKMGIETHKKRVEKFNAETTKIQKITWINLLSFLSHPHHLSYYINFKRNRRKVLNSFWRFSAGLYKIKLAHTNGIITVAEWKEYLKQYFDGTLNSPNEQSRLLVISEVLKFVN